jgi:LAO/AO transport system kinase
VPEIDVDGVAAAVLSGNRLQIARAITLVESTRDDHRRAAGRLLLQLLPRAGRARRVGITGVPGVGKSTFIDAVGMALVQAGHRVAVLAVDPSSRRTGGSILGDRTRMMRLARDQRAFIRPSPAAGTLGGVARATRESMIIMEAANYDVILVETVGVGQSEMTVAGMVDCFLLLTLARAGDQLQGIKKGVLELADVIAVNKAEGANLREANAAARELSTAMQLIYPAGASWRPPVLTCSGQENTGLAEVWQQVLLHEETMRTSGLFDERRKSQQLEWMWSMVHDGLLDRLHAHQKVRAILNTLGDRVASGQLTAALAAQEILAAFGASSGH